MPYIVLGTPYGLAGTTQWLEQLQQVLPCTNLAAVLTEIKTTEARLTAWSNELRSVWGFLWFEKVVLSASSTTALCLAQALRSEWLDTGWMTVICQNEIENKYFENEILESRELAEAEMEKTFILKKSFNNKPQDNENNKKISMTRFSIKTNENVNKKTIEKEVQKY